MGEVFRRRRLPHWDVDGATYFVTACLHDSIPARGLLDIDSYRESLDKQKRPPEISREDWELRLDKLMFARWDEWLDKQPAARHVDDPRLCQLAVKTLNHFAGERYDLWAFVIMPSHFHWVFRPTDAYVQACKLDGKERTARERIMHSVKLHLAIECNKLIGKQGRFWQEESYDHCVRDDEELGRIIEYVEMNRVRAELALSKEAYRYSSAIERASCVIPHMLPLKRR